MSEDDAQEQQGHRLRTDRRPKNTALRMSSLVGGRPSFSVSFLVNAAVSSFVRQAAHVKTIAEPPKKNCSLFSVSF
jgi:hypothetical protein